MKFLSVCSGIEAASEAWNPLGWEAVAFSEIEPFPCAVLKHHHPNTPNLGDMTRYHEWPDTLRFDLLAGGTPCQGFSIAGLREGLDDPRSQLSLTFVEIAARYRPRWMVWENVPGVLSSEGGADFATLLGTFTGREVPIPEGGWKNSGHCEGIPAAYGVAWRVLDAQHFGIPQRRRRVFLVGYLGDWRRAAAVLFERESLRGDSPPRRQAREGIAGTLTKSALDGGSPCGGDGRENLLIPCHTTGAGFWQEGFGTLRGREQDSHENLIAHSLRGEGFDASEDGTGRGTPLVPVAFNLRGREGGAMPKVDLDGLASQRAASGGSSRSYVATTAVRRLTPRECERLQGFPDDHTMIPYGRPNKAKLDADFLKYQLRGNPKHLKREDIDRLAADGPRYKALGNSWAVPCARWIGERIEAVERMVA